MMKTPKSTIIKSKSASKAVAPPTTVPPSPSADLLTIDEALVLLKTTRPTFYRWLRSGRIKGVKVGRQWRFQPTDIERFLQGEGPRLDVGLDLTSLLKQIAEGFSKLKLPAPSASPDSSDVTGVCHQIILLADTYKASDVHIEPLDTQSAYLRFRLDGTLRTMATFDLRLLPPLAQTFKSMSNCDVNQKNTPQHGRIKLELDGRKFDIRSNFMPTILGDNTTLRLLSSQGVNLDLDNLPFSPRDRQNIELALKSPSGIILCTGPTGSGKTTTLYAVVRRMINAEVKVVSLEDPVEYFIPGMTQVQINPNVGLTWSAALRASYSCDPDVILLAELRDREVLSIAIAAALTGHMVLSSLHTHDAASSLRRLIDLGGEPYLVADIARVIISQRLIRKLCPHCSKPFSPPKIQLDQAQRLAREGGLPWETVELKFRQPVGCPQCRLTGYLGRTMAVETLKMSPALSLALIRGASSDELRAVAVSEGMMTFAADGIRQAAAGEVSLAEAVAFGTK